MTFQLQRGVKFHDGTDFNAEAVKWNIERILDPQTKSPQRAPLEPAIAGVTVVDPHTVAFELKKPFAPLLAALAERPGFIVSPTAVKQNGQDFGNQPGGHRPLQVRRMGARLPGDAGAVPGLLGEGQAPRGPGHLPGRP